ncbi:hypothetical protein D5066_04060 [Enterobacter chuandaensis]|nr:hypothetical protein D5066_04060 [Enterobacter chuandaensis]
MSAVCLPGGAALTGPTGAKCRPGKAQPPPGKISPQILNHRQPAVIICAVNNPLRIHKHVA